ncbi:ABC transporter permease [Carboxylicivirga sp. A043]|uniref:ABC transporter permease n=1 Tax=Plebeiibacterium marinum TaxID=2992111 RepID=A0AAE3MGI3_9BACT|nr:MULTISPECIES: ABC transporter permease [Marinilabiliaceae]MCU4156842.1 ABC transporter permease [Carboxylicivirga sp. A043]MCW3807334.1 ABC transporter permease [Plebeiobacterium marinum]
MISIATKQTNPFGVIVSKEISDTVKSWKFIIMVALVLLTCMGSLYAALDDFSAAIKGGSADDDFFFLKLYTHSNGTLPSFLVFISFLGPLLGISMGFDSINTEQNKGTLSRLLAQPIYRDYILNAKFLAALTILSYLFIGLSLLVLGFGLIFIGIPPTTDELMRIIIFSIVNIIYVGFWLNLSILFSVKFRQAATSALAGISVWLFFTIFYSMIVNLIAKGLAPVRFISENQMVSFQRFVQNLMRFNPGQLFNDVTTTLLRPSVRSLGPLTTEQTIGAIPNPLPLGQSLMLVWPQVVALIGGTLLFFAIAYTMFMRREIRSR